MGDVINSMLAIWIRKFLGSHVWPGWAGSPSQLKQTPPPWGGSERMTTETVDQHASQCTTAVPFSRIQHSSSSSAIKVCYASIPACVTTRMLLVRSSMVPPVCHEELLIWIRFPLNMWQNLDSFAEHAANVFFFYDSDTGKQAVSWSKWRKYFTPSKNGKPDQLKHSFQLW